MVGDNLQGDKKVRTNGERESMVKKKESEVKMAIKRHEKKKGSECIGRLGFKIADIIDQMHPFIPMIHKRQEKHYRHSISFCLTAKLIQVSGTCSA